MTVAVAIACAPVLIAQPSPTRPAAGQRVRLHLVPPSSGIDGTVLGWVADTLVLGPLRRERSQPDTLMRIPRSSIVSYQPSLGADRDRGFARGARNGAIVGGMIGGAILLIGVLSDAGRGDCSDCLPVPATLLGGVLGLATAVGGVLIGAAVGSASAPDRWGEAQRVASGDRPVRSRRVALVLSVVR
jgi:hypothetical protein